MTDPAGLLTALALVITAVAGFIKVTREVRQVHKIVNSNNEAMVAEQARLNERVEQLIIALNQGGVDVPERPE